MEATQKQKPFAPQLKRMLGTRGGTLALAAAVAGLAGLVLLLFLGQYKDSVRGGAAPETAVLAGGLIPRGTSGDIVIGQELFKATTVPADRLVEGALADTQALAGQVAVRDIFPGQQITAADFAKSADPVRGQLTGDQRAVSIPLDSAHGLTSLVRSGDRVDVFVGFSGAGGSRGRAQLRTLMQNVLVLDVPAKAADRGSSSKKADITMRVTDKQAAALAFASDNGDVWLSLRPPTGASQQAPSVVSMEALLAGSAPLNAEEK